MGDRGIWGWELDLLKEKGLRNEKRSHQYGCTDPFCPGCLWRGLKNSSECKTTNVKITNVKYDGSLKGITDDGDSIWIHRKYGKEIRNILPPGINVIEKTFGMTIMKNFETIRKSSETPWTCIQIHKKKYEKNITIIHPKGCEPFSQGTIVQIPLENYYS